MRVIRVLCDECKYQAHDKCPVIGQQQVLPHLGEELRLLLSRSTLGTPSVAGPPQGPRSIHAFGILLSVYCILEWILRIQLNEKTD